MVTIGVNNSLVSWYGIEIGESSAIAAGCYISAGNYDANDVDKLIIDKEAYTNDPIIIENNVWLITQMTIQARWSSHQSGFHYLCWLCRDP